MERDCGCRLQDTAVGNFNSHAHVERDQETNPQLLRNLISTHTLTWSVTCQPPNRHEERSNFNSHAHVERDMVQKAKDDPSFISTHTLTWSVTSNFLGGYMDSANFNSHAHVERDYWQQLFRPQIPKFQLTRSRGA